MKASVCGSYLSLSGCADRGFVQNNMLPLPICVCVCVCAYRCISMNVHVYAYKYVHVYVHMYMYVYIYLYIYKYMYAERERERERVGARERERDKHISNTRWPNLPCLVQLGPHLYLLPTIAAPYCRGPAALSRVFLHWRARQRREWLGQIH